MRENDGLSFSREEYQERLKNVWSAMRARNIDVLLLSDPCNLYYTTGYDAWSFYVPQCVLIEEGSTSPVWIGREMDARGAYLTTFIDDGDIEGYADNYVQSRDRHPMVFIASVLRARGLGNAAIGTERSSYYFGATAADILRGELPGATWVDASNLVNWVRVKKSAAEIACMRQAARIAERAMEVAIEKTRVGVRQCDVAAGIYEALISGTSEFGGQYASSPPLMPSGSRVDTPHLPWTDNPYTADTIANFELVAARFRYHVPLGRSVSLGKPNERTRELERALVEGINEVLFRLRPGLEACEAETLWQSAAERFGARKKARCGYSIGIAYPPTFGEQTISLRPGDHTVLTEGMTLHLMPAVWQEGASLVITEPLLITENGCETFCRFDRRLFVRN